MAKGETKKTNKMLDEERSRSLGQQNSFFNEQTGRGNDAYSRGTAEREALRSGYEGIASGSGLAGGMGVYSGGGGGGGYSLSPIRGELESAYRNFSTGGGIDEARMRGGEGTYKDLMNTGGYDDAARGNINKSIAGYQGMAANGGVDAESLNRMRGMGVFDDAIKTGGYNQGDLSNMRARSNAVIPAAYAGMQSDLGTMNRAAGGSAGYGATMAKMGRNQARDMGDNARNTEMDISDRVRAGQRWGAENASGSELSARNMITGNQLAGMGGAGNMQMNLSQNIAGNRMAGASALTGQEANIQPLLFQSKMAGMQGLEQSADAQERQASAASSAAASGANNAREEAMYRDRMKMAGLGGLQDLYGQRPEESAMYDRNRLAGMGMTQEGQQGLLGMRYGAQGNNTSGWDTAAKVLGAGAGAASAFMGMPGMGSGNTGISGMGADPNDPFMATRRRNY